MAGSHIYDAWKGGRTDFFAMGLDWTLLDDHVRGLFLLCGELGDVVVEPGGQLLVRF